MDARERTPFICLLKAGDFRVNFRRILSYQVTKNNGIKRTRYEQNKGPTLGRKIITPHHPGGRKERSAVCGKSDNSSWVKNFA